MKNIIFLLAGTCLVSVGCDSTNASAFDDVPTLMPSTDEFVIRGNVLENTDVSTITRGDNSLGILASDEGAVVQVISFSPEKNEVVIEQNLALDEPEDLEIDFEASTFLDGWFYVTGSHGVAKKKGTYQESRERMYRFRLDSEGNVSDRQAASLAPLLVAHPVLAPHHEVPLQLKGLNVEGLSSRDGHLFVGLRSPNLAGDALVVRISPEAVFSNETAEVELLRVPLGDGLGIRGMTPYRDGFLLIAGNAGSETSKDQPVTQDYIEGRPSQLIFWRPDDGSVTRLGILPQIEQGKEEAILVLSTASETARPEVLILYDSIAGGGGRIFPVEWL